MQLYYAQLNTHSNVSTVAPSPALDFWLVNTILAYSVSVMLDQVFEFSVLGDQQVLDLHTKPEPCILSNPHTECLSVQVSLLLS